MKKNIRKPLIAAAISVAMLGGCASTQPGLVESSNSNATGGALLGAMAGAIVGANSGSHSGRNALF
ncbi:MAG: OmpA family protein, partial [Campylobacterota bacterium]|nr:OmpA family protein [Campylobacterota bacterium]